MGKSDIISGSRSTSSFGASELDFLSRKGERVRAHARNVLAVVGLISIGALLAGLAAIYGAAKGTYR